MHRQSYHINSLLHAYLLVLFGHKDDICETMEIFNAQDIHVLRGLVSYPWNISYLLNIKMRFINGE